MVWIQNHRLARRQSPHTSAHRRSDVARGLVGCGGFAPCLGIYARRLESTHHSKAGTCALLGGTQRLVVIRRLSVYDSRRVMNIGACRPELARHPCILPEEKKLGSRNTSACLSQSGAGIDFSEAQARGGATGQELSGRQNTLDESERVLLLTWPVRCMHHPGGDREGLGQEGGRAGSGGRRAGSVFCSALCLPEWRGRTRLLRTETIATERVASARFEE